MRRFAQTDDAFISVELEIDTFLMPRSGERHTVQSFRRNFSQNNFGM
jgi:hypothetical protein